MRSENEEWEVGRGQLREVNVTMDPDLDVTAFGDPRRTFLRSNRMHIRIDLEIDRDQS